MAYEILVELGVEGEGKLAEGLEESEVPRGTVFTASFTVKNIGHSVFPGGTLTLKVRYAQQLNAESEPTDLPGLQPDKSHEFRERVVAIIEGVGWIFIEIASKDGEQVNLYKTLEGGIQENWGQPFLVVSREMLEIKAELSRLASLLEEASSR